MAYVNKTAHMVAATIVGESSAMDTVADRVLREAKAQALKHRLTGSYLASLHIEVDEGRNGKDRLIVADDPGAVPIEFGWMPIRRVGARRVQSSGRRVPGLHIMGNAYAAVKHVSI